jgi:hypothetical protein
MIAPGAEGVFSFKYRRRNETQRISSRSAIPTRERLASRDENVHARPPRTKIGSRLAIYTAKNPDIFS